MMNSSYDDDDDAFAPNPFRTDNDLLGLPPAPAPQQQQPMQMQQQQMQPGGVMLHQPLNQPDPSSGMTGSYVPSQQQMQQQQPGMMPQSPTPNFQNGQMMGGNSPGRHMEYNPTPLTGQMDQNNNSSNNAAGPSMTSPRTWLSWQCCTSCFQLETYAQYFDMDTEDIVRRIKASVTTFWHPDVFRTAIVGDQRTPEATRHELNAVPLKGPDLYGPIWIGITLVFALAVTSNLSSYMHHQKRVNAADDADSIEAEFEYDLNHMVRAGSVVSTMVAMVPTVLCLACQCLGLPGIPWVLWICVYGYSMVPYLLASGLAWIPIEFVEWILMGAACAVSFLLVVRNLSSPLLQDQPGTQQAKGSPIILAILGCHVIFTLVVKVTFFE